MGDMADIFRAHKEYSKQKKADRLEYHTKKLKELKIPFESHNNGIHLVLYKRIDYWPSTGLWHDRKGKKKGRGYSRMMNHIDTLFNREEPKDE